MPVHDAHFIWYQTKCVDIWHKLTCSGAIFLSPAQSNNREYDACVDRCELQTRWLLRDTRGSSRREECREGAEASLISRNAFKHPSCLYKQLRPSYVISVWKCIILANEQVPTFWQSLTVFCIFPGHRYYLLHTQTPTLCPNILLFMNNVQVIFGSVWALVASLWSLFSVFIVKLKRVWIVFRWAQTSPSSSVKFALTVLLL